MTGEYDFSIILFDFASCLLPPPVAALGPCSLAESLDRSLFHTLQNFRNIAQTHSLTTTTTISQNHHAALLLAYSPEISLLEIRILES